MAFEIGERLRNDTADAGRSITQGGDGASRHDKGYSGHAQPDGWRSAPALAASATLKTNRLRARPGTVTPASGGLRRRRPLEAPEPFRSRSPITNATRNLENHRPTERSTMPSAKVTLHPYQNVSD